VPIIRLISLTPNLKGSAKYFYEAMTHFIFENSGSVQQQLTVPQVQNIKILYPNEDVLKMFDNITSPMIDRIEIIKEENQHLSSLRDWLLPMLMNGQVRPLAPPDKIGINGGG
jgi:type I restriction enzyme S subunit